MIDYKKYLGKEILISWLGREILTEGVLKAVNPPEDIEDYFESLMIETADKSFTVYTSEILQFFPKEEYEDKNTRYYYVIFRYGKTSRSREHIYMSHDYSIKPGDKVLAWQDWLYVGNVIRTGFFYRGMTPYPLEKTWFIEKRVYDRVDFMKYEESDELIDSFNMYRDNYLNSENDHRQFLAQAEDLYESLRKYQFEFLAGRKAVTRNAIVSNVTYELDWEWCESNQIEVFYRTLIICTYMAQQGCYDKFYFDKYKCLSLIYKHGEFDPHMVAKERDKKAIDKDVEYIEAYLKEQ